MEEQQAQPAVVKSSPYQSPMYNYGGSILLLTNPNDELYKMELTFRNMILDRDGNPVPAGNPLMNDKGINSVIGQVQAIVNRVTIMSSLNKSEIPSMIDFLGDTLAKDLMLNRVNYEISLGSSRDKIYFVALSSAYICMKRAIDTGFNDKKFWQGSQQEITTRVENPHIKSGMINKLAGWMK